MNDGISLGKDIKPESLYIFKSTTYIVNYNFGPANYNSQNRMIVIEYVPGRFFKFFGKSNLRRFFVGRVLWHEFINGYTISCPEGLSRQLESYCKLLEDKYKNVLKAKRLRVPKHK